jgi:membrane protease YdiL (CAAX protease family)
MKTVKAFIKSHPVLSYFALTFAISWGLALIIIVVGPGGNLATPGQFEMLVPFVALATLAGPPVAGILLTGILDGRVGFRDLLTRLTRWRVGARWYAVALLTAPLLITAVLFALSLTSPQFLPGILTTSDKAALLLMGIAYAFVGGTFEELGWTGFAIPRMRLSYGVLSTGLTVGLLWGAWHLLSNFWGSGTSSGALSLGLFLPVLLFMVAVLPAYRVLMVWVYDRTESLLVAMLMHASLIVFWYALAPLGIAGVPFFTYYLVLAAATWVVVAAVAMTNRGHLMRQPPLRRRVA